MVSLSDETVIAPFELSQVLRNDICVGREGVEPSQYHYRRILSPLRLPIPPSPRWIYFTLNSDGCSILQINIWDEAPHPSLTVELGSASQALISAVASVVRPIWFRFAVIHPL